MTVPVKLLVVCSVGAAAGAGAIALTVADGRGQAPWATGVLGCAVGWSLIGSGAVASRLRPGNRVGAALIGIGFAWLATFVQYAESSVVSTLGVAVENVYLVGFVFVLLTFPTGRLSSLVDRAFVAAAVALATVIEWMWLLFAPKACGGCSGNAFRVASHADLADAILSAQRTAGVVLSVVTAGVIVRRWRAASASARRQASPIMWVGILLLAALAVSISNDVADAPIGEVPEFIVALLLIALPVAIVVVLLRLRLDRGSVVDLLVELERRPGSSDLRDVLAGALGDPSLQLAYWASEHSMFVDRSGTPVQVDVDAPSVTVIARNGRTIAAVVHDPVVRDVPGLVESASAAVGLRLENEQLEAELRARANALQESRTRLVEVADDERRRIERDLHDGAQQSLVSVAMTLGLARARASAGGDVEPLLGEAQERLEGALTELRELSHGLLPPILRERGLEQALRELVKRFAIPVDLTTDAVGTTQPSVEAALYYVVNEALTNIAKHARATRAHVTLTTASDGVVVRVVDDGVGGADPSGSGLRGLSDRVGALGGSFVVRASEPGGTVIEAWVPCVSS